MTSDDRIQPETTAGPVQVHRGSLIASALDPDRLAAEQRAQVEGGLMAWSLGSELADLMWMTVPESRAALAALAGKELVNAAEYGRFLTGPLYVEVANLVRFDVLLPALADGRDEVVSRTLAVLRRVIHQADGDYRWEIVDGEVIRRLEKAGHADVLQQLDPDLMDLVRETRQRLGQD
ncbi:hypothetical protein AB0P21_02110 [Kribbella sp. NPDC056861]|uniref:hypothetical protein n=1 Tax=Kribbella sp. NPDC056861 TaxID=3154857 RepID=UPI003435C7E0